MRNGFFGSSGFWFGFFAISAGGAYFFLFGPKEAPLDQLATQETHEESRVQEPKINPQAPKSKAEKPEAEVQVRSQIQSFARLNPEQRMDSYVKWVQELNQSQSKEGLERVVRAGLVGFMKLDPDSKTKLRMNFCEALLNRDTPDAIRFVENTAKMNANNPNVISILLKGIQSEGAIERYPVLTSTATRWWNENKALRYEPSLSGFKSDDPLVMKSIEGTKFLTFDIDQIESQLARIKAI